jgi:hypothetical protein
LKTIDINGTQSGSLNHINQFKGNNYCLEIKDVPGAQACTKKRGLTTERHTNPIWPEYKYIGYSELKGVNNNPYGKTAYLEKTKFDKNEEKQPEIKANKEEIVKEQNETVIPVSELKHYE